MSDDILFGAIAVHENLVTHEQLARCLGDQQKRHRLLGEIMVENGFLTPDQVQIVLDIQRVNVADRIENPHAGGLFGQLAVLSGFCAPDDVVSAVRRQTELEGLHRKVRIGQVMLQSGWLSPDQFAEVLRQQEKYMLRCAGCGAWYFVEGLGQTSRLFCRKCHRVTPLPVLPGSNADAPEFAAREGKGEPAAHVRGEHAEAFGPFIVEAETMRTASGAVFRALHRPTGGAVTLRLLHAERAPLAADVERFRRDAAPLAELSHEHIAGFVDAGVVEGHPYVATEHADGATFASALARRLDRDAMLGFLEKVARAAAFAHAKGIVHGALRPSSLLIGRRFGPCILDFGLARLVAAQPFLRREPPAVTPYTPPEGAAGRAPDAAGDVYAIGAMLYEAVAGRLPFPARAPSQLKEQILAGRPQPLDADVPAAWRAVCAASFARRRGDRYASALDLAQDMARALAGQEVRPRRRRLPWVLVAAGLAALAVLAWLLVR